MMPQMRKFPQACPVFAQNDAVIITDLARGLCCCQQMPQRPLQLLLLLL
jgi:hypothetical protein